MGGVPVEQEGWPRRVGRYSMYGEIAAGGMARVHIGRARDDAGFVRTVAIKRLHPHLVQDSELVTMFVDEGRLAARIHHPNVAQVLDVVVQDDEVFIVMEYVRGETLSQLWRRVHASPNPVPLDVTLAIASNILHGLHAAHEACDERGSPLHIVHRDVSPQNIIVGADGHARLLDFGVAKAVARLQSSASGDLKGKVAYMAPEQLGGEASRATDVFALGIVLWECLTAERLFGGGERAEAAVMARVTQCAVPPPSSLRKDIPPALDAIVLTALARDPRARFPSAEAMAEAIANAMSLASPTTVAKWLARIVPDALARRDLAVAEIESIPTMEIPEQTGSGTRARTYDEDAPTSLRISTPSLSGFRPAPQAEPRRRLGFYGALAALVVVLVILFIARRAWVARSYQETWTEDGDPAGAVSAAPDPTQPPAYVDPASSAPPRNKSRTR